MNGLEVTVFTPKERTIYKIHTPTSETSVTTRAQWNNAREAVYNNVIAGNKLTVEENFCYNPTVQNYGVMPNYVFGYDHTVDVLEKCKCELLVRIAPWNKQEYCNQVIPIVHNIMMIATVDHFFCGYLLAVKYPQYYFINIICANGPKGTGQSIMDVFMQHFNDRPIRLMSIPDAIGFYQKKGFHLGKTCDSSFHYDDDFWAKWRGANASDAHKLTPTQEKLIADAIDHDLGHSDECDALVENFKRTRQRKYLTRYFNQACHRDGWRMTRCFKKSKSPARSLLRPSTKSKVVLRPR
jgi:hypothetical protein